MNCKKLRSKIVLSRGNGNYLLYRELLRQSLFVKEALIHSGRCFFLSRGACSKEASWSPKPTVAGSIPVPPVKP